MINPLIYLRGSERRPGQVISVYDMSPDMIRVEDVADVLAKVNRFGGRTEYPYSVAQHAVLTSYLCEDSSLAFECLHHDDPEAFTGYGDALGPSKTDEQRALEQWTRANLISPAFGLETFEPGLVKDADQQALFLEQAYVQGRMDDQLNAFRLPSRGMLWAKEMLAPMHWKAARDQYLERHWELYGVSE